MRNTYAGDMVTDIVNHLRNDMGLLAYEYARDEDLKMDPDTGSATPFVVVGAGVEFLRQQDMMAANNRDAEVQCNISMTFYGAFLQDSHPAQDLMRTVDQDMAFRWRTPYSSELRPWYSGQTAKLAPDAQLHVSLLRIPKWYRCSINLPEA